MNGSDHKGKNNSLSGFMGLLRPFFAPVPAVSKELHLWRERIFSVMLTCGVVLVPPMFTSLSFGILKTPFGNLLLFLLLYALAIFLAFARRIPFTARVYGSLFLFYGLSLSTLLSMGSFGSGRLWLIMFSLTAGLFLGLKQGLYTLPINTATVLCVGFFVTKQGFLIPGEIPVVGKTWFATNVTFVVINLVTTVAVVLMMRVMEILLCREQRLSADLTLSKANLEKEMSLQMDTEASLRQNEEKYRTILENMEEGYYEQDLTGNFVFFNQSLCRIYGYPATEMMGMNYRQYTSPETALKMREIFNELYRTGKPIKVTEYQAVLKDGSTKQVECSAALIRAKDGQPTGFRGIVRDVSGRRKVEEDKKKLEIQLLQAQKMEAIGTLAGGVAHDFNNLLMGMQGNVSLMLLEEASAGTTIRPRLMALEDYIRDATGLTKQLLGFARGGKYELVITNLNDLVEKTSAMFARAKKEIRIHLHLSDIWPVEVDRGQIEQVLLNLFVNAWQAMPDGGDIHIETANKVLDAEHVSPHGLRPGRFVQVAVSDTGMGMDEATLAKVFDPFFTTKDTGRGTGLGLASAYGIMESHGGIVTASSKPGCGATFTLFLPASEKMPAEFKGPADGIVRGRGKVLLVDDEWLILDNVGQMLSALGYTPILADTGEKALDILKEKNREIVLVILDLIMPGMPGKVILERLKSINPQQKVLLSSGYGVDIGAPASMAAQSEGFIQKPYTLEKLSQKIREILSPG